MTIGIISRGKDKYAVRIQHASWSLIDGMKIVLEVDSVTHNWLHPLLVKGATFDLEFPLETVTKPHKIVAKVWIDRLPLKGSTYTEVYLYGKSWKVVEGELENMDVVKEKVIFT